ncbi:MAG: methylmalonyl-CoA mutase family protein [Planctomycetota bacterium]
MMQQESLTLDGRFPLATQADWRELVERDLKGAPFERRLVTHTYEGIDLQPLYGPDTDSPVSGFPGGAPLTRGTEATRDPHARWKILQERAEPTPESVNVHLLDDLEHGVNGVTLRFDAAVRRGLSPAAPGADTLLGVDGVMAHRVEDVRRCLAGVHSGFITVGLEAGAAFLPAAITVLASIEDVAPADLRFWFNGDPLAVLARDGELPASLESSFDDLATLAHYTSEHLPKSRSIRVGTAPYHHAGATAAQDIGLMLATAAEYLRQLEHRGVGAKTAAGQMVISQAVGTHFFLASCKLRAARRLWSAFAGACGLDEDTAPPIHCRTSKRVLTSRDPWVNILRGTSASFAAAVGGADAITTAPFDAALGLPSEHSARVARNTQLVLHDEADLGRVIDPAGGSWYLEQLTEKLAERGWAFFQEIEAAGGMAAALSAGLVHDRIDSVFKDRARSLATRRDAITGVSEFANIDERVIEPASYDLDEARASLAGFTAPVAVKKDAAVSELITAARDGAAIGDLFAATAHGPARHGAAIAPHPYAEPFERLRDRAEAFEAGCGRRPTALLVNIGPLAVHGARAAFSTSFFAAGGFEVVHSPPLETAADAAAFLHNPDGSQRGDIAVICSSDTVYAERLEEIAPALHRAGSGPVVLAGHPGEREAGYRAAGVDRFIFLKCNAVDILSGLLDTLGAPA